MIGTNWSRSLKRGVAVGAAALTAMGGVAGASIRRGRPAFLAALAVLATAVLAGGVPAAGARGETPPVTATSGDVNEVIIDQHKGIATGDDPYIVNFGVHDLTAYKQIRIFVVGDCDFDPPYNCAADHQHLTDTVDLELRAQMGDPRFIVSTTPLWRSIHWMIGSDGDKGVPKTETLDMIGGMVEFRVHYFSGPVHLRVLGRRN